MIQIRNPLASFHHLFETEILLEYEGSNFALSGRKAIKTATLNLELKKGSGTSSYKYFLLQLAFNDFYDHPLDFILNSEKPHSEQVDNSDGIITRILLNIDETHFILSGTIEIKPVSLYNYSGDKIHFDAFIGLEKIRMPNFVSKMKQVLKNQPDLFSQYKI